MTDLSVSVVGSFRNHYPNVVRAVLTFESFGIIVRSPVVSEIINPGEQFARFKLDPPDLSEHYIQSVTLANLFASSVIYVVAPGGYIGNTTCYELGRIHERGIPVYFSAEPLDLPIEVPAETIVDVAVLCRRLLSRREVRSVHEQPS